MLLDWSNRRPNGPAEIGDPKPCIDCGRNAILRDPATDLPRHKTCAEEHLDAQVTAYGHAGDAA